MAKPKSRTLVLDGVEDIVYTVAVQLPSGTEQFHLDGPVEIEIRNTTTGVGVRETVITLRQVPK